MKGESMNLHKRLMLPLTRILVLYTLLTGVRATATIALVDQWNSVGGSITRGDMQPGQSLGQSFTPSGGGIDLFEILALSQGVSTTQINLFAGQTMTGTPIATSGTVIISSGTLQTTNYQFPETVSLVHGSIYTARLDLIAGDSYMLEFSSANPYSRGLALNEDGDAVPNVDLVFSEGLAVIPEPSTLGLLAGGCITIFTHRSRRRRLSEKYKQLNRTKHFTLR
jgi:hypothetical protein